MNGIINATRLILRSWQSFNLPIFARINADCEIMRYFPATLSVAESDVFAAAMQALIALQGWAFWAVEERLTRYFIGFVGLNTVAADFPLDGGFYV